MVLCHPLLLLPPIPPSIRVFSNESTLRMRWPKYWSFTFSIIPSKEIARVLEWGAVAFSEVDSDLIKNHDLKNPKWSKETGIFVFKARILEWVSIPFSR